MNRQPSNPTPENFTPPDEEQSAALEAELQTLSLRQPSDMLDARITASLSPATASLNPPVVAPRHWHLALTVAAAVALLALAGVSYYIQSTGTSTPPIVDNPPRDNRVADPKNPQQPVVVQATHHFDPKPIYLHWSREMDAGTLESEDSGPAHAIRRQDVLHRVWVDAERGVMIQLIEPRERLMVSKQNVF